MLNLLPRERMALLACEGFELARRGQHLSHQHRAALHHFGWERPESGMEKTAKMFDAEVQRLSTSRHDAGPQTHPASWRGALPSVTPQSTWHNYLRKLRTLIKAPDSMKDDEVLEKSTAHITGNRPHVHLMSTDSGTRTKWTMSDTASCFQRQVERITGKK